MQQLDPSDREKLNVVDSFIAQSSRQDADLLPVLRVCSAECEKNVLAQVHFRLSGALRIAVDSFLRSSQDAISAELLHLIGSAIDNQPLSIRSAEEFGLLTALTRVIHSSTADSSIRAEGLKVLRRCCSPVAPTNTRASIFRNPVFLETFCSEVNETSTPSPNAPNIGFLAEYLAFLKEMVFSEYGRVTAEGISSFVPSLSNILTMKELLTLWDTSVEVLVGCSQIGRLKAQFIAPLSNGQTPVSLLLNIVRLGSDASCNCLAILFNLTVDSDDTVRNLIAMEGGLEIAVSALNHPSGETYSLRCLQLLSRISTTKEVQAQLLQTHYYSLICQGIRDSCGDVHSDGNSSNKEICGYLVNTLACLNNPPPDCRKVAGELGLVRNILKIFPEPRQELGVITPESVIQVPKESVPVIMLGNAARCLMPYADDAASNKDIYLDRTLRGIEKLVCAMATISDIRVRKNIAILLAKGCRMPVVRERVSELRGIQMMVELQDYLL